jgi:DNA-binding GntR family transcriptional regulator
MLSEKAYKTIKAMIYRGELAPGQRLVERKLSQNLGVSRVPLRESFLRLESEGLITSVPRGPAYVMDFSKSDVVEMYSMRLLLEPFATRLAALNHKPSLIGELSELCQRMTKATRSKAWEKMDELECKFHSEIVKASGHNKLRQAYGQCHIFMINGMLSVHGLVPLDQPAETTALHHMPIIEALEKRDPDLAERVAFDHVKNSVEKVREYFGGWVAQEEKIPIESPMLRAARRNRH